MFIPTQRIREVQTPRDLKGHRAQPPHVALKAAQFLHSPGGLPSPTRWGPNSLCASSTLHHVTGFISRPTAYPSTLHLHFRINKQCAFSRTHHASSNLQDSAVTSLGHTSTPWTSTCSHVTTTAKNSLNLSFREHCCPFLHHPVTLFMCLWQRVFLILCKPMLFVCLLPSEGELLEGRDYISFILSSLHLGWHQASSL